ncbi:MAG: hypothetical protein IJO79_03840, partial [Firmicutes bacterium]|nr:hypothetical protein [Bacillota bacterium]
MMARTNLRKVGRKVLALLLTVTLVLSMLTCAFGAPIPDQTMDGYFAVAADGTYALSEDTTVTEDGFTLSKTIEQTGVDTFDITLEVQTSQTVETSVPKAATVLVIDLSN